MLIGTVEKFFSKLGVAAVDLTGDLAIGDTIEIENGDYVIKETVISMQIDKEDVERASDGDSVGIVVSQAVKAGSRVYRLSRE